MTYHSRIKAEVLNKKLWFLSGFLYERNPFVVVISFIIAFLHPSSLPCPISNLAISYLVHIEV